MERRRLLDINGIPFEENLVFYAPLIQGDTTDHISGKSVVVDTQASLSWDSSEGAYYFNARNLPLPSYRNGFSWKNLAMGLFNSSTTTSSVEYTIYANIKIAYAGNIEFSRFMPSLAYVGGNGTYEYFMAMRGDFFNLTSIDGQWHKYVTRCHAGTTDAIKDTVIMSTRATAISLGNMTLLDGNKYVSFYITYSTNDFRGAEYIRDIRVYNRALSDDEIKQL